MQNQLLTQLSTIRHKVRLTLWLRGGCYLLATVVGLLLVVGWGDWFFHFNDPGVRLILGLSVLATVGWIVWRYLIQPLQQPFDNAQLASRVERRFPMFQDRYASSISFLEHQSDSRSGSPLLQNRVINKTIEQAMQVDVTDIIETGPVNRVALIALGVCLFAGGITLWNHDDAGIAMGRLISPFSAQPWPRETVLKFVNDKCQTVSTQKYQVARGKALELFVVNQQGKLPDDLMLEYQFADEPVVREKMHRAVITDSDGESHSVGTFLLTARKGPLKYRATGGDDQHQSMQFVDVIPPPMIEELSVRLIPPSYTQKKPFHLPANVGHIRALVGTRIEMTIKTSKQLISAELHRNGEPIERLDPALTKSSTSENKTFTCSFTITEAGTSSYWIELIDVQQLKSHQPTHYDLEGLLDAPPDIYITEPSADLSVTANATIPVRVVAKDDLAINNIDFVFQRRDLVNSPVEKISLFNEINFTKKKAVTYEWDLAQLNLPEKAKIEFYAEVFDNYNLQKAHAARSLVRLLTIVSATQKKEELIIREISLIDDLRRSFRMQQDSHENVLGLSLQLQQAGQFQEADLDLLKRAELDQRQISAQLINPTDGIESRAVTLLQEFRRNKISSPKMQKRLDGLIGTLSQLRKEVLPKIDQSLLHARKNGESFRTNSTSSQKQQSQMKQETLKGIQSAGKKQQVIIETLSELLDEYSVWQNRQQLSTEIEKLINSQQALLSKTDQLAKQTFGKKLEQLTLQQRADLARLAQQQSRLPRQHAELTKQMQKMLSQSNRENSAFSSVREALAEMNLQNTQGKMQEAVEQLKTNRMGQAIQKQKQIIENLRTSRQVLQNRLSNENEMLLKKLNLAAQKLETLEKRQRELLQKRRKVEQLTNKGKREQQLMQLRKEQQLLQKEVAKQMRTLQRLRSRKASATLRRATQKMQQAADEMEQESATDNQQEALDDLTQSRRELARDQQEVKDQLAREMLEKFSDMIATLVTRQQSIITETKRIHAEQIKRKRWSRGLLKSLKIITSAQKQLQHDSTTYTTQLSNAEIISISLRGAARNMDRAVTQLSQKNTGIETVNFEVAALRRLKHLDDVMKLKNNKQPIVDHTGGGASGEPGKPTESEVISTITQLRVMKLLQKEILTRTTELNRREQKSGTLTEEETSELESLAEEQALLTERIRNLLQRYENFEAEQQQKKESILP